MKSSAKFNSFPGVSALIGLLAISATLDAPAAAQGPVNDECAFAIAISEGATAYNTTSATESGPALPNACNEGFGLLFGADIWFDYLPTFTGVLEVRTCAQAGYDSRLAAYTGSCEALTIIACNDDGPGCGVTSIMCVPIEIGTIVHLRVGGFASASGTGTLTLTSDPTGALCTQFFPPQDTIFSNGMVNNITGTFPGRLVIFNNTTVNFNGGSIGSDALGLDSVTIFDTSVFNMFGGSTTGGRIAALDNSVVTLNGGTLGFDSFVGDSIVTFGNPAIDVFNINASGKAAAVGGTITIFGGSFSGASTFSTGTIEIFDGSFAGQVTAQDFSTLILRGGSVGDDFGDSVVGFGSAVVEVRGGSFTGRIGAVGNSLVINVFGCPLSLDGSGVLTGVLEDGTPISVNTFGPINLIAPCTGLTITTTAFEPPMGKKKKIGSTLPIKFRLFFDGVEILSEAQLNQILADNGCTPGCPKLLIFLEDGVIGLPPDDVDDNVGDPDDGDCFRYSAPNWIYNVRLLPPAFMPNSCYRVEIEVGGCVLVPDNNFFETK